MSEQESNKGFWGAVRHAFAIPKDKPLTDRQREWLEKLAQKAVQRGLTCPAMMLLESVKPLNYVGAHVVLFFKPLISALFPPERCDEVASLLERRDGLEELIQMIERADREAKDKRPQRDSER
jgi:hypothetical protein